MSSASQNGTPTGRPSRTRGNQEVAETYRGLVGTEKCMILGALIMCTQIKFSSMFGSTNNRQVATSLNPRITTRSACGSSHKFRELRLRQIPAFPHSHNSRLRQVTAICAVRACSNLPQIPQFANRTGIFTVVKYDPPPPGVQAAAYAPYNSSAEISSSLSFSARLRDPSPRG